MGEWNVSRPKPVGRYWKPKDHAGALHLVVGGKAARRGDYPHDPWLTDDNRDHEIAIVRTVIVFTDENTVNRYDDQIIRQSVLSRQVVHSEVVLGVLDRPGKAWEFDDPSDEQIEAVEGWLDAMAERDDDGQVIIRGSL